MSEAPERISIYPIEGTWDYGGMEFAESTEPNQVQYVRADRIEQLEAKLSKAMQHVADYSNDPHLVEWALTTLTAIKESKDD